MGDSTHYLALLNELDRRVAEYATPLPQISSEVYSRQAVSFMMADTPMIIDMADVVEVLPQPPVTRLPGVKKWVKGIANVRGDILTIVDLSEFFGLRSSRSAAMSRVIAVEKDDTRLGMVVDRILGMRQISTRDLQEQAAENCPDVVREFVSGSAMVGETWSNLLDPEKLFGSNKFMQASTLR